MTQSIPSGRMPVQLTPAFSYGHGLPSRCSSNSLRNFCTYEIIGIAAASPNGQNVRPSMFSARYFMLSMSFATPPPEWKRDQRLLQPVRSFAAGNAPSAAFVLIELHHPQRKLHDALRVVKHDHAARTQHRAGLQRRNRNPWRRRSRPASGSAPMIRRARRPSTCARSECRRQRRKSSS